MKATRSIPQPSCASGAFSRLSLLTVLFCLTGFLVPAQYLPALGPAPLRWKEPPPAGSLASLPPLPLTQPVAELPAQAPAPPASAMMEPAAASVSTNRSAADLPAALPESSTNLTLVEAAAPSLATNAAPAFPMETLAPFFSSSFGTNRSAAVTQPLSFSPPAAPPPRSSTANYSVTKP